MTKLRPPEGTPNPVYNGQRVGPEGIDVEGAEAEALAGEGWVPVVAGELPAVAARPELEQRELEQREIEPPEDFARRSLPPLPPLPEGFEPPPPFQPIDDFEPSVGLPEQEGSDR